MRRLLPLVGAELEERRVGLAEADQPPLEHLQAILLVGRPRRQPDEALDLRLRLLDLALSGLEVAVDEPLHVRIAAADRRRCCDQLVRDRVGDRGHANRVGIGDRDREERAVAGRLGSDQLPELVRGGVEALLGDDPAQQGARRDEVRVRLRQALAREELVVVRAHGLERLADDERDLALVHLLERVAHEERGAAGEQDARDEQPEPAAQDGNGASGVHLALVLRRDRAGVVPGCLDGV